MKKLFQPSLLKKFLVAFFLVAIVPLLIAGYFTLQRADEELKSSLNENYHLIGIEITRSIDEVYIRNWLGNLLTYADVIAEEPEAETRNALMNTFLRQTDELFVLSLLIEQQDQPLHYLKDQEIGSLYQTSPEAVARFFRFTTDSVRAERQVSPPILIPATGGIYLPIEVPVVLSSGRAARIRAVYNLTPAIRSVYERLSLGQREVYLIDGDGHILHANDAARFQSGDTLRYPFIADVQTGIRSTVRTFQVKTFQYEGTRYLGNFAITQHTNWAVVIIDQYSRAYALVRSMEKNMYFWVGIALVLSIAFSTIFARSFAKSIRYLARKSRQIGEGDFDVEIEVPSRDEIGQLASDLREMTVHLKEAVRVREELVTIQQEVEIASKIQHSILPESSPAMHRLNVAARYIPMAGVAGDFYDFHTVSEHELGVLIADVSGHGIPAALISAMAKIAFSLQNSIASEPGRLLEGMNSTLEGQIEDQFLTACYIYIDTKTNKLVVGDAGHPPLLVWKSEPGEMLKIKPKGGVLMGWMPDIRCPEETIGLDAGDRIVLYTDGIVEAQDPDDMLFGEDRFTRFIREHDHLPPGDCIDALITRLSEWVGDREGFEDDVTVIIIDIS